MAQQQSAVEAEYQGARAELDRLTSSQAWQNAKNAADVAGIIDPTPTSDLISGGMSAAEGDLIGVGLSGLSLLPWLGDAVAKPIKAIRAARSMKAITEGMEAASKRVNAMASKALRDKEAARRVREARKKKAQACKTCDAEKKWGTQLPKKGKWSGERGNSTWTSEDGKYTVPYKEGYPDFKNATGPEGGPITRGEAQIDNMQGNNSTDFRAARDDMRRQTGDPSWPGTKDYAPDGYTWHHTEDGSTMQLVRSDVHGRAVAEGESGAAHTGGASITRSPEF